ncbi:MAG: M48 family metallopeptidase [Candidatus Omnitrophota bacterium]|nr:M48 family metallopeptidase [Candidatus Omnitrophota bacterium]
MSSGYDLTRSKKYSAIKTWIFVANIVLTVLALAFFWVFLSRPVAGIAFSLRANFYAACAFFSVIFLLFMYLALFPLHLADSFYVERRFGLSRQSFGAWLTDEAKSVVLSFTLSIVCIQGFYLLLRNFPSYWWVISASVWIFFTIILARFLPVLLIPLFFKYLPIEEEGLKERIVRLGERSGIPIMDVCRIDFSRKTAKANAALVGLGGTRKVILADTLTDEFTGEEVEAVVAHEFGHVKYRHIWKLIAFSGAATYTGFFVLFLLAGKIVVLAGARGLSDLYLLPLLAILMAVSGIILLPLQNFFSRILERQADRFALEITNKAGTFISVMRKLALMNLADVDPPLLKKVFLYDHPPVNERIRMAKEFRSQGE